MKNPRWRLRWPLLLLALAAMGWDTTVTDARGRASATTIRITATEFKFTPRKLRLEPGMYRFVLINRGKVFHDLEIAELTAGHAGRSSAPHAHIAKAQAYPGQTDVATAMLKPGVYRFMCHVPGHSAAGMKGKLVVKTT